MSDIVHPTIKGQYSMLVALVCKRDSPLKPL